jgi:membrane-associated phospholipid phosphatase
VNLLTQFFGSRSKWLSIGLVASVLCRSLAAQPAQQETSSYDTAGLISSSNDDSSNSTNDTTDPPGGPSYKPSGCDVSQLKACVKDFFGDQAGIWTSPFRLHAQDAIWLLPLAGATAVSLHYDVQALQHVSTSPNRIRISNDLSDLGTYGAVGAAGATYLFGRITHSETARETGVLSLEAIADASVVTEVLKLATNRERPYTGTGQGRFWPHGTLIYTTNGSFPSEHATVIWAFSRVIVDETPGHRWLHLGLYTLAAGVSVARVTSRNHFPSDAVVGSAIGYLVGGYVYRRHSDSDDSNNSAFTITPAYDMATHSYGLGITMDPSALHAVRLKQLWSRASSSVRTRAVLSSNASLETTDNRNQ